MQLSSIIGGVIRQDTPPDVTLNPRYKNWLWIQEGNPPSIKCYDIVAGAWRLTGSNGTDVGTPLTQVFVPVIAPASGTSVTDGFIITHTDPSATIYYSINGGDLATTVSGAIILSGVPDYMYVTAFAVKAGMLDSDIVISEFPRG